MKIVIELLNDFDMRNRPVKIPVGKYGYVEVMPVKEKKNNEVDN